MRCLTHLQSSQRPHHRHSPWHVCITPTLITLAEHRLLVHCHLHPQIICYIVVLKVLSDQAGGNPAGCGSRQEYKYLENNEMYLEDSMDMLKNIENDMREIVPSQIEDGHEDFSSGDKIDKNVAVDDISFFDKV